MGKSLTIGAAVAALAALAAVPVAATAHGPARAQPTARSAQAPVIANPRTRLITTLPVGRAIAGEFAHTGSFFYVSGDDSVTVVDATDPRAPRRRGVVQLGQFENEAMSYGERPGAGGRIARRLVLVGNDLVNGRVDPNRPPGEGGVAQRGRVGGGQVVVVDVTNPDQPVVAGRTPGSATAKGAVTSSTHAVQCATLSCRYAYTAGDSGMFSIVDLRDPAKPVEVKKLPSSAAGPSPVFTSGAGHHWDVDHGTKVAWHTGSGGAAAFDVADPLNPKALNGTNAKGIETPFNDFILHNAIRPNGRGFKAGASPGLRSGNVLLLTEEDYADDGDQVDCSKAGTLQAWHVPELDGRRYRAANPGGIPPGRGSITPLDTINPVAAGDGLSTTVGAFCSAHWFDYHQNGYVAQGYYQRGMRIIDVRDPRDLEQHGFFTPADGEVWDAHFVPERDDRGVRIEGRKSDIVYSVDAVRGLDVIQAEIPGAAIGPAGGSGGGSGATGSVRCTSRRLFRIQLTEPRGSRGRLRSARVTIDGRRVRVSRRGARLTVRVDLRGAGERTVTVRVVGTTSERRRVRETRRYRIC